MLLFWCLGVILCLMTPVLSDPHSPTPRIKWFKKGGDLPERKARFENFNKTLSIVSVSDEDSGDYICMASNKMGSIRHTISVQVKGQTKRRYESKHLAPWKLIYCLIAF